jgi:outer membrane protein assembly factor BamA
MNVQTNKSLFYGFENRSAVESPAQYGLQSAGGEVKVGVNVFEGAVVGVGAGTLRTSVGRGERENEPQFVDVYRGRPYVDGTYQNLYKIFALYDTQTPMLAPTSGTKALVQYEAGPDTAPEVERLLAQVSHLVPLPGENFVLALRARHERVWGGDNPFYNQARLGGMNTLRGYRSSRWTDSASILYGAEGRWRFWEPNGAVQRLELNLGYDTGRVYNEGAVDVLFEDLRPDYVAGLTFVFRQGIPLRLDFAHSPEGDQFYLHLLYPF